MKRIILITANCLLCVYLATAAYINTRHLTPDTEECQGIVITLHDEVMEGLLTAEGVRKIITDHHLNPVGQQLHQVDLRQLEEFLESMDLIARAECYATQDCNVHVDIHQRHPVMRIIDNGGANYYVDEQGLILSPREYPCNLPVATGNISAYYAQHTLAPIGAIIQNDAFWRNQVEQFNVLQDSTIEMIPRVGKHVIYLGQPTDIPLKLTRLRKFYNHGLSVVGWNKYKRISLEINNQIICKK